MLRCRRGERCLKVGTRLTSDARRSGRGHRYREQLYGRELKTKNAKRTVSCTRRSARPRAKYDRRNRTRTPSRHGPARSRSDAPRSASCGTTRSESWTRGSGRRVYNVKHTLRDRSQRRGEVGLRGDRAASRGPSEEIGRTSGSYGRCCICGATGHRRPSTDREQRIA